MTEIDVIREKYRHASRSYSGALAHDVYAMLDHIAQIEAENKALVEELLILKAENQAKQVAGLALLEKLNEIQSRVHGIRMDLQGER